MWTCGLRPLHAGDRGFEPPSAAILKLSCAAASRLNVITNAATQRGGPAKLALSRTSQNSELCLTFCCGLGAPNGTLSSLRESATAE